MEVDHISLLTTPVFLSKGDKLVLQGTGFFYLHQDSDNKILYLVTNYHVLTGLSPTANKLPIGDNIVFQLHLSDTDTGKVKAVRFPLLTKIGKPVWITSSSYPQADLAVIPLVYSLYQDCKVIKCISAEWAKANLKVRPTSLVTVVGYPYGYYDKKNALPVWKTGSVASEPEVDFEGKPYFLIDVSAFPGMSGAPVFAIGSGAYEVEEGRTTIGGVRRFLGIYASMQMRRKEKYLEEIGHDARVGIVDEESLEIGHVWKAALILETVKSVDVNKYESEILKNLA